MRMAMMALMVGTALCGATQDGWQAGVAKLEITPEEPMWLSVYAGRDHESEGTLHPLWVKALALQDAQQKTWNDLRELLAGEGIHVVEAGDLTGDERAAMEQYFLTQVFPVMTPLALEKK